MTEIPLGIRVRTLRRAKDWTQRELGTRAGINHITISRLEHGDSAHVYAETIVALARALGCTTDHLLGMDQADDAGRAACQHTA